MRLADLREKSVSSKVLVCHQVTAHEVVRCAVELDATQIIQDTNPYFSSELSSALEMMDHPDSFLNMPFSTILTPDNISWAQEKNLTLREIAFSKSSDKDRTLAAVEGAVTALAWPQSLMYDLRLVADELFMNALYNAPMTAQSSKVDRTMKVQLPAGQAGRMALAKDAGRLVLVCEDGFGSLDVSIFLSRLFKCYEDGARNAMNWGAGGAGIGCYMIFESCMSIFLGVKPDQKTVVACVFALGTSMRARQEMSKSIHYTKKNS